MVFVVQFFFSPGSVDDQLVVQLKPVEDVLRREDAFSELVGFEQRLLVERVFIDGRLLLEVIRKGVHAIYKKTNNRYNFNY